MHQVNPVETGGYGSQWQWSARYSAGFTCTANSRIKKKNINSNKFSGIRNPVEVDICLVQLPEKVENGIRAR